MKKLAHHWELNNEGIKCNLCPNYCHLKEGSSGPCQTRIVENKQLFTIAYGNPIAFNIDPVEKKPLYHFKPGHRTFSLATAGCNLHCRCCQNASISQEAPILEPETMYPEDVIRITKEAKCQSISLTYTDPVAYYEYALDIAKLASQHQIPVIFVSAGYINPPALKEILPYISAANIDLKSMSDAFYRQHCRARLNPVLQTIQTLHQSKVWLEITNLLIPQLNDSDLQINKLCSWLAENNMKEVPLHFTRFSPKYKLSKIGPTPQSSMLNAFNISRQHGLKHVYLGNIDSNKYSTTICPNCGKELIHRNNYTISHNETFNGQCTECNSLIKGVW